MKKVKSKKDILLELSKTNGLKKLELSKVIGGFKQNIDCHPDTWEDTGSSCDQDPCPNV